MAAEPNWRLSAAREFAYSKLLPRIARFAPVKVLIPPNGETARAKQALTASLLGLEDYFRTPLGG